MSMFEDDSYSDGDEDFGDGVDYSSQHSQDWQEQRHQLDEVGQPTAAAGGGLRGQRADSQQMSTSSARRGKRKGAYTEEERRYRRRLANRESARRMRAKRNQEVKQLENTLNQLQDRNEKLEAQNREYAKSLQQLQQEMHSLRTQLQGNMGSSQQQQSSSEVHQVLSCGTAMHPHQHQMLLQGNGNQGSGLHFSGQLSFTGALNSMPPGIAAADQRNQAQLAPPLPAAAAAVAATGLSVLQQQFAAAGSMQGAQACAGGQYFEQQSWQLQGFDQQQQAQPQQVTQMVSEQQQVAYAGTGRCAAPSGGPDILQQQQQVSGQAQQQVPARTVSEAAAVTVRSPVGVQIPHAKSHPQLQTLQDRLSAEQQSLSIQQQQSAAAGTPVGVQHPASGTQAGTQAAEGALDVGIFPACAEDLLNELLMSHTPEQQADAGGADAAAAAATELEAAAPPPPGPDTSSPGAEQQQQEQKQQEQQPSQRMEPPSKPSGFRPWGLVGAGGLGSPASLHAVVQQQAALQRQHEQQQGQQTRAGSAPPGAVQHAQQLSPAAAIAAIAAGADAAGAGAEQEGAAAAAAAMLAARGRAFAGVGYANPANLCGFEIPDIQPAAAPATQQPAQAPAAAGAGVAAMPDPFAAWAHRFVPPAGSTAAVVQQLGNALQLDLPEAAAGAVMAGAVPDAHLQAFAGAAREGAAYMAQQGMGSSHHRQHSHHSSGKPVPAPVGRKPKRRFPLKQPSRLAAQQVAAVQAAAAAAAGFSDLHTASTVCQGSCGLDWVDAGTAMQAQLEQQKRRRLRKQLHAAAAAVGDEAVRMLSASSRVGGEAGAAPTLSDEVVGTGSAEVAASAAAALQRTASAAAAAAAASPTSRPRSAAAAFPQQYNALWQQHAAGAAAGVPEAVCLQRTFSSVDQRQPAFSVPVDWAGAQLGPETSVVADGCRSYASEPGAGADVDGAGAAAGSVLDWGGGCGAAVDNWSWQLQQLEQQGLITRNVTAGAAGRALQQHQQAQMQEGPWVAPFRPGAGDGGMPSPRAAAVLNAAAAAAATAGGAQGQHTGVAPGALPILSPQLVHLQQQLQHYLQRNRGSKAQPQAQLAVQQQGVQAVAAHRHLSVQVPQQYGGSGDLDHAVPGSPPAAWLEPQQQQQQPQYSAGQPLVASKGPAAAAAVQGSASGAAAPSVSQASRGSGATSPKGQAIAAPAAAPVGTAEFAPAGLLPATGAARQGLEPGAGAAVLNPRVPGGIDFGDLDLPEAPPELDALLTAMLQQEPQQPGARNSPAQHQVQLRQEVTEASAGLQGLWLNPDGNGGELAHTPTGLGFSASVSQGLALGAGGVGVLASPVTARLGGMGAGSAGPIRATSSAGMQAPVGMGAGGAEAAASEPGSLQYMAATAAAAGQPPWSTWHEEQQQWLDDIFSSGPTLPHEPDAAS